MTKSRRRFISEALTALRNEEGVAAVEFAMLSPAFIALIVVAILAGIVFMAKSELDYATQRVARLIMTRQVTTSSQLQTQLCNYIGGIFNCNSLMVNLTQYASLASMNTSSPTLTYNAGGSVSNTWNSQFGSAGSIMVLQIMYQYPMNSGLLFNLASQSNGTDLLISTAVFVNE